MTRRNTTKTENVTEVSAAPAETVEKVTDAKEPVNLEVQTSEEPVAAPEAPAPEKLQTDFREKLGRKTDNQDVFVPSNPAALEKAAAEVAKDNGFELTRGTSIGARLLARAQKRV